MRAHNAAGQAAPMRVFGELPPNPPPDIVLVDTPVGQPCELCGLAIHPGDVGLMLPTGPDTWIPQHKFCAATELSLFEHKYAVMWKALAKRYFTELQEARAILRQLDQLTVLHLLAKRPPD